MPLDADRLRDDIVARFDSLFSVPAPGNDINAADRVAAINAIAEAVVDEIKDNANVAGACPPGGGPLSGGTIL